MDNRVRVGRDLLSGLPVGIIENILTHLPIIDAIRTSILSTKWRYRWATIPHLVFNEDEIDDECLKTFVTRTLLRHEGPIHKFRLVSRIDHCPETDQWLFYLSRKGIKELILEINQWDCDFDMPCLYAFRYLTLLELYGCRFGPPPPIFQGFLWLKSLILRNVEVPSDAIHSIVAHSPLLENLEYSTYAENFELRVSAPNLKYFRLMCTDQQTSLCAPLLAKMSVSLDLDSMNGGVYERKPLVCNYTDFLGGVTNLESLTGDGYFLRYLSVGIEFCQHPLVFNHLKIIALCGVDFQYKDEILVLVRLIVDASANLRELQLEVSSYEENDESKIPGIRIWDSECPKNFTFGKLKVITMTCFRSGIHEMKFIKFLLESSPVLETMNIEQDDCHYKSKKRILSSAFKLLSYCRASRNAKILFIKR